MTSSPVAAVDCGTNSTRLLIVGPDGDSIDRRMQITRFGQGVDRTKRLAPEAIARTLDVLRQYRQVMDAAAVTKVRMTATSAARDAANRDEFFDAAEAIVGVRPELLSGDEEGRLAFTGATASLDPAGGPYLVVDIGGGSTEFVLGPDPGTADGGPEQGTADGGPDLGTADGGSDRATTDRGADRLTPVGAISVNMGCVRLTERFLYSDPPQPEELAQALSVVDDYIEDVRRALPGIGRARTLVGLAGTVTSVAAVELGYYDREKTHHFVLTREAAEDVFRTLATESRAQRVFNPGLEEARADVIVGGCVVLVGILRRLSFPHCLVSEEDILDGLAASLLQPAG